MSNKNKDHNLEQSNFIFMEKALTQASLALAKDEVPVGAIIVDSNGKIVAKAFNKTEKMACQTGHAEVIAICKATKKRRNWRLDDCSIYVTLEPCLMCIGLISLSRIRKVFYGATSPLFGAGLDREAFFTVYKSDLKVEGGILSEQSVNLLRVFFKKRRSQKGKL